MAGLREQVKQAQSRTTKIDLLIAQKLKPAEIEELHELLADDMVALSAVLRVLDDRGIKMSYSSLMRYKQSVLKR